MEESAYEVNRIGDQNSDNISETGSTYSSISATTGKSTSSTSSEKSYSTPSRTFPFPTCWDNDERMNVLMAPFRNRELNPENYDCKMKFWQDQITLYCEYKGAAFFNKRELQLTFMRDQTTPYGLDTVLEHMLRSKLIRTRYDYEYDPLNSWSGWAMNSFVKRPLAWGVQKIRNSLGAIDVNKQALLEYVHLGVIQDFCDNLQTRVFKIHEGTVLHYDNLKELLASLSLYLTEESLQLCLNTLHAQNKIGLHFKSEDNSTYIHLIKIPSKSNKNINITETDLAIHNLEVTQKNLLKQLKDLADQIMLNEQKTRQCLAENKRSLAKTFLRKKHLLEDNHLKRSNALNNIEIMLSKVNEAQSNGEILDAYKIGSKALQSVLRESGLEYNAVDEVLDNVRDSLDNHADVQHSMNNLNGSMSNNDIQDGDLERELREILAEDENKSQLPQTPVNNKTVNNNNNNNANDNIVAGTVTNDDKKQKTTSNSSSTIVYPSNSQITDAELISLLAGLGVEEHSLKTNISTHENTTI